jgi:hypothetical protein
MENINEECEICFDSYIDTVNVKKPFCLFPCGHTFCFECISSLTNKLCPKCKTRFTEKATNWAIIHKVNGLNSKNRSNIFTKAVCCFFFSFKIIMYLKNKLFMFIEELCFVIQF